jgi:hypothetical protein
MLSVIRKRSRHDIVVSSINSSILCENCIMLRLNANMRLGAYIVLAKHEEIANFGKGILSIKGSDDSANENGESKIDISELDRFCIPFFCYILV